MHCGWTCGKKIISLTRYGLGSCSCRISWWKIIGCPRMHEELNILVPFLQGVFRPAPSGSNHPANLLYTRAVSEAFMRSSHHSLAVSLVGSWHASMIWPVHLPLYRVAQRTFMHHLSSCDTFFAAERLNTTVKSVIHPVQTAN